MCEVTSFRQETCQSYYRNDPVKYNLNLSNKGGVPTKSKDGFHLAAGPHCFKLHLDFIFLQSGSNILPPKNFSPFSLIMEWFQVKLSRHVETSGVEKKKINWMLWGGCCCHAPEGRVKVLSRLEDQSFMRKSLRLNSSQTIHTSLVSSVPFSAHNSRTNEKRKKEKAPLTPSVSLMLMKSDLSLTEVTASTPWLLYIRGLIGEVGRS